MQTLKARSLAWHHLHTPSAADLKWVRQHFHFHSMVLDELTQPTARPRVESYDDHLYLVLHFPLFDPRERKTHSAEVDFVFTKKELVTVAYESIPPLDDFFRKCSTEKSCEDLYASKTTAHLLFYVLKELYAFALRELDHIQDNVNRIEEEIFSGREREVVEELSVVRRDIIDFRRAIKPQLMTLESLAEHGVVMFGPALQPFFNGLIGEFTKVWDLLENNKEALDALYDNNATLLEVKQNDTMKILTIMAFTTFPLMLFTALFSMDTIATPIIGSPYDFWIIVSIMLAATVSMFLFFKRKKWL
ncbi:MAG: magnesium transporter CorA family protein [Candidatus Sungbacteria bacterium]|uniref:Magnesium transporter CorA family protein n=1 Tax=Candidatus Sungiibacteriota bacterium TaxID=2750080 RepID=A0A932YYJ8_9BACT|nr:magnesium transporter CorA family protein [Candidatus Sungbacteria bacterium]